MAREPVLYRVLDVLGLLACCLGASGSALRAIEAQGWLSRTVFGALAVALAVFVVRATPVFLRDWRRSPGSGA
jgi:hypothetical protein